MNPSKDPLVKSLRKVNREHDKTPGARLAKLYRKRSLYRRRITLALAGLEACQDEIESLLVEQTGDVFLGGAK